MASSISDCDIKATAFAESQCDIYSVHRQLQRGVRITLVKEEHENKGRYGIMGINLTIWDTDTINSTYYKHG